MGRSNRDVAKPDNSLDRATGWTRRMAEPGDWVALWSESIVQRIVGSREEEFAGGVGRECVEKSRKGA